MNRARCWIALQNKTEALKDINSAQQLGEKGGDELIRAAQVLSN